jgi:hypothetical protein
MLGTGIVHLPECGLHALVLARLVLPQLEERPRIFVPEVLRRSPPHCRPAEQSEGATALRCVN